MTIAAKIKTFDDKIKVNQAQYDLDRETAKISALASKELDKYKYLTSKDLGYKTKVTEQAKFEYSPLGKFFNKGLKENDKKRRTFKKAKQCQRF